MTFVKIFFVIGIVIYIGYAVAVYFYPHLFLYHPDIKRPTVIQMVQKLPSVQEVSLSKISDAYGWYVASPKAQKAIVFFHGNSDNAYAFVNRVEPFVRAGYTVLMLEYQGFGGRKGKPSQSALETDAKLAVDYLNKQGFSNKQIVLYGHSMGTYVAVYTAAVMGQKSPFLGVILESPFVNLVKVADKRSFHLYPTRFILRGNTFDTDKYIGRIKSPVFIGHGMQDKTVPYEQGEHLFEMANTPKQFFSSEEATHRSLPAYGFLTQALKFIDENNI